MRSGTTALSLNTGSSQRAKRAMMGSSNRKNDVDDYGRNIASLQNISVSSLKMILQLLFYFDMIDLQFISPNTIFPVQRWRSVT